MKFQIDEKRFIEAPFGPILYVTFMQERVLKIFKDTVDTIKKDKNKKDKAANHKLVGAIEEEYSLREYLTGEDGHFVLTELVKECAEFHNWNLKSDRHLSMSFIPGREMPHTDFKLHDIWINFQKKHDYNPKHNHFGHYSMTGYINIPYSIQAEYNTERQVGTEKTAGCISFDHGSDTYAPTNRTIVPEEGKMIFFPSGLRHQVFPFYTSDDLRISFSANFVVKSELMNT